MFGFGYHIFLHVSTVKGMMRFGRKEKLNPRHIGPFEILHIVGEVDYELDLPLNFFAVY